MRWRGAAVIVLAAAAWAGAFATPAPGAPLRAGVGRADITPPTGYFLMGWVRSDAVGNGQHTRLYARAIVLEKDGRKLALVAEDLNGIPGGVLKAAADQLGANGFSEQNILDSASHTHAAPSQFYNFGSYDTVFMTNATLTKHNVTGAIDPQLYAFEVRQLVTAIRRADNDLGPARAAWGSTQLLGVTQNRSLEAHLANFGIQEAFGTGSVGQDPGGYADTIDPAVDVLRVDKLLSATEPAASGRDACRRRPSHGPRRKRRCHNKAGRHHRRARHRRSRHHHHHRRRRRGGSGRTVSRYVPVGMWSTFANHGTVNKASFTFYNADHHGAAMRVSEQALRSEGRTPPDQEVVNAYGNSDEGDVTAGIMHTGPAEAEWVGRQEAGAMLAAWRDAGTRLSDGLSLDTRWTRLCFCGQATLGGTVDSQAVFGIPQLTGSEEGRGPLYDNTHVPFEGDHLPADADPVQGDKIQDARPPALTVPQAVPMMAARLGDRMLVSVPGEMTVTMGQRLRQAVINVGAPAGISRVVIAGLAGEYLSYFTTPEEFEAQHYEGGSTLYGKYSSNLLQQSLADLAGRLVGGQPAPGAYPYDPTNGVTATAAPFGEGATSATASAQPQATARFGHAELRWAGGPRGLDRPLGGAFVTIRRQVAGRWQDAADDRGLEILWSVDDQGVHKAVWEVPRDAPEGTYEFLITANHYRLESAPFTVTAARTLTLERSTPAGGGGAFELHYPAASPEQDITWRPTRADGGVATVSVGGRVVTVEGHGGSFDVAAPPGTQVTIAAGAVRDAHGNVNGNSLSFTA